ncbi:MCP-domain signal transduction protein, partial [Campylobacter jejuni]|nr:MCP-domain signal transduction protein [Campylobacter jejuni]EAL6131215.1 MCP-domain signal transduction protein [Campylobacter jejuni]EAL7171198.1 MCP-domain signal transduction protein [Campylobacter jejuni]EAL7929571.1 MCP-domain signal transduction protein [Campylobacter jejuni]EBD1919217.1 MCP-domain signal transduction protein [Campylobacter jejuni]
QKYSDFKYYYLNIKGQKLEMTNEINKIILNQLKCYEDVLAKLN